MNDRDGNLFDSKEVAAKSLDMAFFAIGNDTRRASNKKCWLFALYPEFLGSLVETKNESDYCFEDSA